MRLVSVLSSSPKDRPKLPKVHKINHNLRKESREAEDRRRVERKEEVRGQAVLTDRGL
jgi:hypothetical protein